MGVGTGDAVTTGGVTGVPDTEVEPPPPPPPPQAVKSDAEMRTATSRYLRNNTVEQVSFLVRKTLMNSE